MRQSQARICSLHQSSDAKGAYYVFKLVVIVFAGILGSHWSDSSHVAGICPLIGGAVDVL